MSVYLNESIRIAKQLSGNLIFEKNYAYWECLKYNIEFEGGGKFEWNCSEGIYGGNAGIVLFFIELFKETKDENYLNVIQPVLNWMLIQSEQPTENYSLYTGRFSTAYIFLKWYAHTGDVQWLAAAENCTAKAEDFLNLELNDLMLGLSGAIIFLLHLHSLTKKERYLELIEAFVSRLISRAWIGPRGGLYWDRNESQIHGLCGFSHGASGIGQAFLELAQYLGNSTYLWLAREAFSYEDAYYNANEKNWPDFRKDTVRKSDLIKCELALNEKDLIYFYKDQYMNAWCHGAAGIGLARMRAYEITKEEDFKQQYLNCLSHRTDLKNFEANYGKFTLALCHGFAGNADLHLSHQKNFDANFDLTYIHRMSKVILKKRAEKYLYRSGYYMSEKEDNSLYMGIAGIGYFFLRLHNPEIPSPLIFKGPGKPNDHHGSDTSSKKWSQLQVVKKDLLEKRFFRTLHLFQTIDLTLDLDEILGEKNTDLRSTEDAFCRLVEELLALTKNTPEFILARDIYQLEKRKMELDREDISNFYLGTIQRLRAVQAREKINFSSDNLKLMNLEIQAHHHYVHHVSKAHWSAYPSHVIEAEIEKEPVNYILIPGLRGILEFPVSEIVVAIINECQHKIRVATFMNNFRQKFETNSSAETEEIIKMIMKKLEELHACNLILLTKSKLQHK